MEQVWQLLMTARTGRTTSRSASGNAASWTSAGCRAATRMSKEREEKLAPVPPAPRPLRWGRPEVGSGAPSGAPAAEELPRPVPTWRQLKDLRPGFEALARTLAEILGPWRS